MKKTYQIERDLFVGANSSKNFNFQLKETYAKCVGFFLVPRASGVNFANVQIGLNIAQQEILPINTDASLFAVNNYVARSDAEYNFEEENIPARSSEVQFSVKNDSNTAQYFHAYFILKND